MKTFPGKPLALLLGSQTVGIVCAAVFSFRTQSTEHGPPLHGVAVFFVVMLPLVLLLWRAGRTVANMPVTTTRQRCRPAAWLLLGFILGLLPATLQANRWRRARDGLAFAPTGKSLSGEGLILPDLREGEKARVYPVQVQDQATGNPVAVSLIVMKWYGKGLAAPLFQPGMRIAFKGAPASEKPGFWPFAQAVASGRHTALFARPTQIRVLDEGRAPLQVRLRRALSDRLSRHLHGDAVWLAQAIVLGDTAPLRGRVIGGELVSDLFKRAGIGHIISVSGLHIAMVAAAWLAVCRGLRLGPRTAAVSAIALCGAYVWLVGAPACAVRSWLMCALTLLAKTWGGRGWSASAKTGLMVSAICILLPAPFTLFDMGFLLSYGSVASLVWLCPLFDRCLRDLCGARLAVCVMAAAAALAWAARRPRLDVATWASLLALGVALALVTRVALSPHPESVEPENLTPPRRIRRAIKTFVRSLLTAQCAVYAGVMIPFSGLLFGNFSTAGMVVNLAAIPASSVFIPAAALAALAGCIPVMGPPVAWAAGWVATAAGKFLLAAVVHLSTPFTFPESAPAGLAWLAVYYALLIAWAVWFGKKPDEDAIKAYRAG